MSHREHRIHPPTTPRRLSVETLEHRAMLAATPTIGLCECADTGAKGDGITYAVAPRFTGTATPRAQLTLALEGGSPLGTARANAFGEWEFVSRRVRIPDGVQTIRITEKGPDGAPAGTATTVVTFDRAKPTVAISSTGINTFRIAFSQPVTGFTSELKGLVLSGRPAGAPAFTVPLSSPQVRGLLGEIDVTPLPDGKSYELRIPGDPIPSGIYTIRLNGLRSGIMSSTSGARMTNNMVYVFSVP